MAEAAEASAPVEAPAPEAAAPAEAEHDALIAELEAEFAEGDSEPARLEKGAKKAVQAKKGEPVDTDGDAEPEGEEAGESEDGNEAQVQTIDEFREHAKDIARSGDIRKLEEVLGLEKNTLRVDGGKVRYARQRLEKAEKAQAAAHQKYGEANTILSDAQQQYGGMVRAKHLFAGGTPQGIQQAARFVEGHFGVPLAQFVDAVVKAGRGEAGPQRGPDPEVTELKRTVQQLLTEQQQARKAETERQQTERHVSLIKGKLGGHSIAQLPDAAQLVYAKIKSSYDSTIDGYKLTLKDAIAAVAADPATKWRLHELAQKRAPKDAAGPTNGKRPAKAANGKAPTRKAATPAESEEAEKRALIAELEAEARKEERAQRYARH